MDIPGLLNASIEKMDESRVKDEERGLVNNAREVAETVLRSHLSNIPSLENPSGLLRAAARTIILDSPDFQRLLKDAGARIVDAPPATVH